MHFFNLIAAFGLATLAAAAPQVSDSSMSSKASTPTSSPAVDMTTSTAPASPTTACLTACGTDLCCQAACVGVPCPNQAQANATTECAMQCNQGDGSAADTKAYGDCQSSCISSLFFTSTGVAAATGTSSRAPSNSASATGSSSGSARASGDSTASSSASAASASTTGNAASSIQIGASTAGMLGLLMAALLL